MTHTTPAGRTDRVPAILTRRGLLLIALGATLLFVLPAATAIYLEGEAPAHTGAYVQADVATPDDPLTNPLNLSDPELRDLSGRAADATRSPGTLLNMTTDEEADFQRLVTRLEQGGHDGVQVNGTGYRFAIAMAEVFATGNPDGGDGAGQPNGETPDVDPDGDQAAEVGEANGIAIGGLTLLSAGAMYWVRRLA